MPEYSITIPHMSIWRRWYLDFRIWFGLKFVEQPPPSREGMQGLKPRVVNIGWRQVLKMQSNYNECIILQFISRCNIMPVPKVYGAWYRQGTYFYPGEGSLVECCLVTQQVPGMPLGTVHKQISQDNMQDIINSIRMYLERLREVEQPEILEGRICSFVGSEMEDEGLTGYGPVPPMAPSDLVDYLLNTWIDDRPVKERLFRAILSKANERGLYLTHGDLHPYNIIVDRNHRTGQWEVTAIVDWTTAGWYPDYWECHKARRGHQGFWNEWAPKLAGDFSEECAIVQKLTRGLRW